MVLFLFLTSGVVGTVGVVRVVGVVGMVGVVGVVGVVVFNEGGGVVGMVEG